MERVIAGGVLFFSLILVADIDPLAEIAVAFAYLILLSATMTVGPVAFARISKMVGGSSSASSSGSGSHAGSQVA